MRKAKTIVSPKAALAAAITKLGPDATSEELTRYIRTRFGVRIQFMIAEAKRTAHLKMPAQPFRRKAG